MAASSSSSSSSSYIYIPKSYSFHSQEQLKNLEKNYGNKKDEQKESDADKKICSVAESAIMTCTPSIGAGIGVSEVATVTMSREPMRRFPTATELSPVEIWDLIPAPECIIAGARGNAAPIVHKPRRLTPAFQTCYDNVQFINRFFLEVLSINPIQTFTHTMQVKMHRGPRNNAEWNWGDECVYVGERSSSHLSLESNLSIIAHEFGHAMIYYSSRFNYINQSGALHEHGADVIGIMTKHYRSRQLSGGEDTDWRIGEGLFVDHPTHAFRSMNNPGTACIGDNQPNHMHSYNHTELDFGGVHINCGIPNKAFYLTALRFIGHSWEHAGRIWVTALQEATQHETFEMFAHRTAEVTKRFYGEPEYDIVRRSWHDVGVCTRDWEMIVTEKRKIERINDTINHVDKIGDDCIIFRPYADFEIGIHVIRREMMMRQLKKIYHPIKIYGHRLSPI